MEQLETKAIIWECGKMKTGLIMVDIQNDYFKGGRCELYNQEHATMQAKKILTFFRERGWPVLHVRHINKHPGATFFIPDTEGSEFYKETAPLEGEDVIVKFRVDSFLGTNLNAKIVQKGIDTLVICGMMTHMCIDSTVRTAAGYGYAVTVIEDACTTKDLIWRDKTVPAEHVNYSYMAALNGVFANVMKADEWIKKQEEKKD